MNRKTPIKSAFKPAEKPSAPAEGGIKNWQALIILAAAILAVYSNSLHNPFIFDDAFISSDYGLRHLQDIKTQLDTLSRNDRILTFLTFSVNYYLGRLDPYGYHLFNILLHILNTILVYFLARKLLSLISRVNFGNNFAFFTALVFAAHPVNTEVVTYIYNRSASLAAFFYISSYLLFLEAVPKRRTGLYLLSLACFSLALLSKQVAATLPVMLLVSDYLFLSDYDIKKTAKNRYYHLGFWLILALMILLTLFYFKKGDNTAGSYLLPLPAYLANQPLVIVKYLQLLLVPAGLCIDHFLKPIKTFFEFRALFSYAIIAGIFYVAFRSFRLKTTGARIVLFGILWFLINLLPAVIFRVHAGERQVYLSSFGLYFILIYLFCLAAKPGPVLAVLVMLYSSVLGIAAFERNRIYKSPVLLWQDAVSKYPYNSRAHYGLACSLQAEKKYKDAVDEYNRVLAINPDDEKTHNNLGVIYFEQGAYPEAVREYRKVLEVNPADKSIHNNLGLIYKNQNNFSEALREFNEALALDPDYAEARYNTGLLYYKLREYARAETEFNLALKINPDYAEVYYDMGIMYDDMKEYDKAVGSYRRAIELKPDFIDAYNNLGFIYYERKEYAPAIRAYTGALAINPGSVSAHNNLGALYYQLKDYGKALAEFEAILKLQPDDTNIKAIVEKLKNMK